MSDSPDPFPEGWALGIESWRFHRQFFARVGRPTAYAEYAGFLAQIRYRIAERLDRYHHRITMLDGSKLIVGGGYHRLNEVEPADWQPKQVQPAKPAAREQRAVQATVTKPSVQAEPAPPRKPVRASTLTLGNPAAAKALAERLRRIGVPASVASGGASPP